MTGPRRHQIKAYVSLVAHEKFKLLAERHKRSINREAEDLIENAVKDVELPVRLPPKPVYAPPDEHEMEEPFEPLEKLYTLLMARWIPEAVAEVRAECARRGIPFDIKPVLSEQYRVGYRKRALEAGRDPDKDLEQLP